MKTLYAVTGAIIEWIFSVLWMPVHYRNKLQAEVSAAQTRARAATAQELASNAQVMAVLYGMGSDFRPLARLIADRLHAYYGVEQSKASPGNLVPIRRDASDAN